MRGHTSPAILDRERCVLMKVVKKLDKIGLCWVEFLKQYEFNYMATFTFRDDHGKFFVGPKRAFKLQSDYFKTIPLKIDRYFSVAEPHEWRDNVHLHTLLKSSLEGKDLWKIWWAKEKSFARILKINDNARSYCAKYLNKNSDIECDHKLENLKNKKEDKLF